MLLLLELCLKCNPYMNSVSLNETLKHSFSALMLLCITTRGEEMKWTMLQCYVLYEIIMNL